MNISVRVTGLSGQLGAAAVRALAERLRLAAPRRPVDAAETPDEAARSRPVSDAPR
jgi:hypothetical protein